MSVLVSISRENGNMPVDVSDGIQDAALANLKQRPDFDSVLRFLASKGYLSLTVYDYDEIWEVVLTDSGYAFFENDHAILVERRWTRGLAIAALLISI